MRSLALLLSMIVGVCSVSSTGWGAEPPQPIEILFLGDNGHHLPSRRFEQLQPVLARRGINLHYTDDMQNLNGETLAKFDGLLVYANIDEIQPAQAQALLDYVASGKGFIPLHCASYCFRNNEAVVALIGAQFQRHGGGVFRTTLSEAAGTHPLMKGFQGFESWDETYVHTKHNEKDRIVLEYRTEGDQREPWTWVRTHGKGRVFYTAWGHDERTWSNAGFQNLVERGIRWAVGSDPAMVPDFADRPQMTTLRKDVKPFEFADAIVPFYPAGKPWGTIAGPITKIQKPLPAEESLKHFVTPVGFHVELFATEPEIGKPLAMTWDEGGRLWLCETLDYPNELQPGDQGRDRIRICEDTDGDGRADKFTVFAEHLSIPTAIAFHRGGVIVQDGVRTLYLKDTDGDDKADVRKTLLTGWNLGDTHGGVSNFQYGLDNWFWGMQGYNDSAPSGSEPSGAGSGKQAAQRFRMGFFRFRLDDKDPPSVAEVEFVRSTNNNTWGLGFSEEGVVFGSTANGNPSEYMPIPNRYYERVRGWSAEVLQGIAESNKFEPITENVRQVDHHGGFTAAAGHALYTARVWPKEYWNRTAFVTEPTGHLVATFVLSNQGAGYRSKNSWNILASNDEWTAPIMAEVGPDGQLWVIDWYNLIVQHNPTPAGYKTGKGQAYEIDLRDKTHGRIYRVMYDEPSPMTTVPANDARPRLGSPRQLMERMHAQVAGRIVSKDVTLNPQQMAGALRSTSFQTRRQVQRLLVERGNQDVVPELLKLVQDPSVDEIGLNTAAIHAIWTLHGLNVISGTNARIVQQALKHPSPGVRRNAVQVLPRDDESRLSLLSGGPGGGVLNDVDPQVRLAALLTLSECPPSDDAARTLVLILMRDDVVSDRWLREALTVACAANAEQVLQRVIAAAFDSSKNRGVFDGPARDVLAIVSEHYGRGAPVETVGRLLEAIDRAAMSPHIPETILKGIAKGWPKGTPASLTPEAEAKLPELLKSLSPTAKSALINLAVNWGVKSLDKHLAEIAASFLAVVENEKASDADRIAAAGQFIELRRTDAEASAKVLTLITAQTSPELARGLVEALGGSDAAQTGSAMVERIRSFSPAVRGVAIRVLLSRPEWTAALLDAIDAKEVQMADLALDQRQALAAHPNKDLAARAKEMLARGGGLPDADRQKVLDELLPLTKQTADAKLGKEVFTKQCAKCHTHSGEGGKVGPDLTGMAVHPKHELLTHIIDPNRNVEGNFRVYTVLLNSGTVVSGLLVSESKTAIEVIDVEAKKHAIQRSDIEELVASAKSLMPEGFEKQVPPADIANLLEFLTQRGKFTPLPLDKAVTVISTKGMFFGDEGDVERLVFPDWNPRTFEGVPFVLIDPQGDRVPNAIMLRGPHGVKPPKMPEKVTLPCNGAAKAIHFLSGVGGWSFPAEPKGSVSMIVRLHYADGQTEDHPLINGEHFADYIRRVDVPGSKFAYALRGQQIRYLAVYPKRADKIDTIELVKGPDRTAPVVMAVTVEAP